MNKTENNTDDHFGKALGFVMFGVMAGLGLDICAKKLLEDYALGQFVFLRSVFGISFFLISARWYGGLGLLKTQRWRWHGLRTILATGAMFGFFFGLSKMPLVDTLTIVFVAPLIVTALSVPLLGEQVGWRRWVAVVSGFIGVIIVLRPGEGMFTPAALALLLAAFCWAGLAVTARKLATTESSFSLAFYVTAAPLFVSAFMLPGNYVEPTSSDWVLFVLTGLFSALAWVGVVGGYRRAPPVVLAPFEYTALIGAAIAGYFIWGEVPDGFVLLGGLIIIAGGIYIVYREVDSASVNRHLRSFTAASSATILRRLRQVRN